MGREAWQSPEWRSPESVAFSLNPAATQEWRAAREVSSAAPAECLLELARQEMQRSVNVYAAYSAKLGERANENRRLLEELEHGLSGNTSAPHWDTDAASGTEYRPDVHLQAYFKEQVI